MSDAAANLGGKEDRVGQLAASLVAELGLEGAVSVCRNNHWLGVLKRIEIRAKTEPEPGITNQVRTA